MSRSTSTRVLGAVALMGALALSPALGLSGADAATAAPAATTSSCNGSSGNTGGPISQADVLKRAQSWVTAKVAYDQSSCYDNAYGTYRMDCSGFVSMAWGLSGSLVTWTLDPTISGDPDLFKVISKNDLRPGDALVAHNADVQHVVLFTGWSAGDDGAHRYFDYSAEANTADDTVHRTHQDITGSYWGQYKAIRYAKMTFPAPRVPIQGSGLGDVTGDGVADLLGVRPDGVLNAYQGTGTGGVNAGVQVGAGWNQFDAIMRGDFDGDRKQDLLARKPAGSLVFYKGNGGAPRIGLFNAGVTLTTTTGWQQFDRILSPGDLNKDGLDDLIARRPDGTLYFYASTGAPGVRSAVQIGAGWYQFSQLFAAGDVNHDGTGDLLGLKANGDLQLYKGTSTGAVGNVGAIGSGWDRLTDLTGVGDLDRDGDTDIAGINGASGLAVHSSSATSTLTLPYTRTIGAGWTQYDALL